MTTTNIRYALGQVRNTFEAVHSLNSKFFAELSFVPVPNLAVQTMLKHDGNSLTVSAYDFVASAKPRTVVDDNSEALIEYVFLVKHEAAVKPDTFIEVFRFYLRNDGGIAEDLDFQNILGDINMPNFANTLCSKVIQATLNSVVYKPRATA